MKKILLLLFIGISTCLSAQNTTIGSFTMYEDSTGYCLLNGNDTISVDSTGITVKFDENATSNDILSFSQNYNLSYIRETIGGYVSYLTSPNSQFLLVCDSIINESIVETFVFHYPITLHSVIPDDPDVLDQWYLNQCAVLDAWDLTMGNEDIIVAVIDEGLFNHDDIADENEVLENIYHNSGEDDWNHWDDPTSGNGIDDDGNGKIDDFKGWNYCNHVSPPPHLEEDNNVIPEQSWGFHGTAVSGVISAKTNNGTDIAGVAGGNFDNNAGGVKILPIKMIDYKWNPVMLEWDEVGNSSAIPAAIMYAIERGAHVINMSFGLTPSPSLHNDIEAALEYAYLNNVVIIGSVGNEGHTNSISYPANSSFVMGVGATDQYDEDADFSNNGDEIEIAAPGVDFLVLNKNSVTYMEGTSFSAPMVAATAGLMLSVNPFLTNVETRNILHNTAEKVGSHSYNQDGWNKYLGYGRLNTYWAVCEALELLPPMTITASGVWSEPVFSLKDITIETGNTLTINTSVYMGREASIIVEPGAKLIIDNGLITNYKHCGHENNSWPGIQVWGIGSGHQFPDANGNYQQGYLEINNSTIENAVIAVDLWNPEDQTWSSMGGIVKASDATFKNNAKSIHALYFTNHHPNIPSLEMDYQAFFDNCSFEIASDYLADYTFYKHVDITHVKGVKFRACDFTVDPNATNIAQYNHAIAAYTAGFSALGICTQQSPGTNECTDWDPCTFTGFQSAVYANATADFYTYYISNADFINNEYGIFSQNVSNQIVLFSDFKIGQNITDAAECIYPSGHGIYFDACTGFTIEENAFSKYSGAPASTYTGISIKNTNDIDEVYKNLFTGLSYANYSDGKNWKEDDKFLGLAYYCNTNSGNYADFYVAHSDISGIQDNQGNSIVPAGNKFTYAGAEHHFHNGGNYRIGYYYCDHDPIYNDPYCPDEDPDIDWQYDYVTEEPVKDNNECLSHYGGTAKSVILTSQEKLQAEQAYFVNLTDYNNVKTLYSSYIDGGDTDAEINDVQSAQPDDMWVLRAQLLGDSPHLSQEVLMETADRTDVFPDEVLLEILSANPDELKKDTLISYLENKEDPLPDYMIDILLQVSEGTTYKTVLELEMSGYARAKSRAANDIIRSIVHDTVCDYNELRNWLDNLGGLRADHQIIATYVHESNFTDALNLASMLPQLYELSGNDSIEHEYYVDILNLQSNLHIQGRNMHQLDSSEISLLQNIADNSIGYAGAQAKGILSSCYGIYFSECQNCDEGSSAYKSHGASMDALAEAYGLSISVKPNPAKAWAAFDYTLPSGSTSAIISIKEITGKTITEIPVSGKQGQEIWDTRNIPPGVYIYTINANGMLQSGKIIIQ